jgi:hypothetical protein
MTEEQINELERLAKAATPGPWKHRTISKTATVILAADTPLCATKYSVNKDHDAAYIIAACNAVPELIVRVRELKAQREYLARISSFGCYEYSRNWHSRACLDCPFDGKPCSAINAEDWMNAAERRVAKEAGE